MIKQFLLLLLEIKTLDKGDVSFTEDKMRIKYNSRKGS
jgi:hypothetical protein